MLEVVHEARHVQVQSPTAARRHAEVDGRTEQWVREAHDAVVADDDRPGGDGSSTRALTLGFLEPLLQRGRRRALDRRHELEQRSRFGRKRLTRSPTNSSSDDGTGSCARRSAGSRSAAVNSSANIGLPREAVWTADTVERGRRTSNR